MAETRFVATPPASPHDQARAADSKKPGGFKDDMLVPPTPPNSRPLSPEHRQEIAREGGDRADSSSPLGPNTVTVGGTRNGLELHKELDKLNLNVEERNDQRFTGTHRRSQDGHGSDSAISLSSNASGSGPSPTSPKNRQDADLTKELESSSAPGYKKGEPKACLFVASLNAQRTDEQLQESVLEHFKKWGTILNVKVLKDWLQRPYSFVQFEKIEDAKRALTEAHNTIVDGRHIRVEQARVNRTLFLAKFHRQMTERQLKEILERYGPIEDLTILQNYVTGKSKGCGFVKFQYREDAIRAYLGLRSNTKYAVEWASNLDRGNVDIDKHSIFVGQLNQQEVTEDLLREHFSKYGKIESLQLINKSAGSPPQSLADVRPAFAFIKFEKEESAAEAIGKENGNVWLDRTIRVQQREIGDVRNRPTFSPLGMSMFATAMNQALNANPMQAHIYQTLRPQFTEMYPGGMQTSPENATPILPPPLVAGPPPPEYSPMMPFEIPPFIPPSPVPPPMVGDSSMMMFGPPMMMNTQGGLVTGGYNSAGGHRRRLSTSTGQLNAFSRTSGPAWRPAPTPAAPGMPPGTLGTQFYPNPYAQMPQTFPAMGQTFFSSGEQNGVHNMGGTNGSLGTGDGSADIQA